MKGLLFLFILFAFLIYKVSSTQLPPHTDCHSKGFLCYDDDRFYQCVDIGNATVTMGEPQFCPRGLKCIDDNEIECEEPWDDIQTEQVEEVYSDISIFEETSGAVAGAAILNTSDQNSQYTDTFQTETVLVTERNNLGTTEINQITFYGGTGIENNGSMDIQATEIPLSETADEFLQWGHYDSTWKSEVDITQATETETVESTAVTDAPEDDEYDYIYDFWREGTLLENNETEIPIETTSSTKQPTEVANFDTITFSTTVDDVTTWPEIFKLTTVKSASTQHMLIINNTSHFQEQSFEFTMKLNEIPITSDKSVYLSNTANEDTSEHKELFSPNERENEEGLTSLEESLVSTSTEKIPEFTTLSSLAEILQSDNQAALNYEEKGKLIESETEADDVAINNNTLLVLELLTTTQLNKLSEEIVTESLHLESAELTSLQENVYEADSSTSTTNFEDETESSYLNFTSREKVNTIRGINTESPYFETEKLNFYDTNTSTTPRNFQDNTESSELHFPISERVDTTLDADTITSRNFEDETGSSQLYHATSEKVYTVSKELSSVEENIYATGTSTTPRNSEDETGSSQLYSTTNEELDTVSKELMDTLTTSRNFTDETGTSHLYSIISEEVDTVKEINIQTSDLESEQLSSIQENFYTTNMSTTTRNFEDQTRSSQLYYITSDVVKTQEINTKTVDAESKEFSSIQESSDAVDKLTTKKNYEDNTESLQVYFTNSEEINTEFESEESSFSQKNIYGADISTSRTNFEDYNRTLHHHSASSDEPTVTSTSELNTDSTINTDNSSEASPVEDSTHSLVYFPITSTSTSTNIETVNKDFTTENEEVARNFDTTNRIKIEEKSTFSSNPILNNHQVNNFERDKEYEFTTLLTNSSTVEENDTEIIVNGKQYDQFFSGNVSSTSPSSKSVELELADISYLSSSVAPTQNTSNLFDEFPVTQATYTIAPFPCLSVGKFPDSKSCSKFYLCINAFVQYIAILLDCPKGTLFDSVLRECTRRPVQCPGEIPLTCTKSGVYPHPTDCSRYYKCLWRSFRKNFFLKQFRCPEGTRFHSKNRRCERATAADCTNSFVTLEGVDFECLEVGRFAVAENCRDYFECKEKNGKMSLHRKSCSESKLFDAEWGRCRKMHLVVCPFSDYDSRESSEIDDRRAEYE